MCRNEGLKEVLKRVDRAVGIVEDAISIGCLVVIILIVSSQVFFRYVLGFSLVWVDEVVANLLVLMVMFGAPAVTRRYLHTDLRLLVDSLPPRIGRAVRAIAGMIGLFFLCVFVYSAARYTFDARGMVTTVLKVPMPYAYSMMFVGSVLMLYEYVKTVPRMLGIEKR